MKNSKHEGIPVVQLIFQFDTDLINFIKSNTLAYWSQSMKCWYLPEDKFNYGEFLNLCGNRYHVDGSEFNNGKIYGVQEKELGAKNKSGLNPVLVIDADTDYQIEKFKEWMVSRRYSRHTIKIYSNSLRVFFRFFAGKKITEVTNNNLVEFNNRYILANGYSATLQNQVVNCLK